MRNEVRKRGQTPIWYNALINADGSTKNIIINHNYLAYSMMPKEIWARSYAQYITEKSSSIEMKSQLAIEIGWPKHDVYSVQWSTEDFKPISAAIDALFTKLGWLK